MPASGNLTWPEALAIPAMFLGVFAALAAIAVCLFGGAYLILQAIFA
jgi:hypothetical protein